MPTPNTPPDRPTGIARGIERLHMERAQRLKDLAGFVQRGWDLIWENPHYTDVEVLAALGTEAAEVFRLAAMFTADIYAADPTLLDVKYLSAKKPYTAHDDGTVTIND